MSFRIFSVYVIELDGRVWTENRFRWHNHHRNLAKPCLYVGMTGRDPQTRFDQHRSGYRANRYARRFGVRLRPDLAVGPGVGGARALQFLRRDDALNAEAALAAYLRSLGYAVWQN
jgi:hypothetical protein